MRNLGLALIVFSFLIGAYLTVLHPTEVNWMVFIPVALVGVVGVALLRRAERALAQAPERLTADLVRLEESLGRVVEQVARLDAEKESIDTYDVHGLIDELLLEDLDAFINARDAISHVHGLQAYAEVMNRFAAGERYLNRVWSASADGYIDEVHAYLTKARDQLADARDYLHALDSADVPK